MAPLAGRKNISEASLLAALIKHDGIMSRAAKSLGITRQTVSERVKNSPRLAAALATADEANSPANGKVGETQLTFRARPPSTRGVLEFEIARPLSVIGVMLC